MISDIPLSFTDIVKLSFHYEEDLDNSYIPLTFQSRISGTGTGHCKRKQQLTKLNDMIRFLNEQTLKNANGKPIKLIPELAEPFDEKSLGIFAMGRAIEDSIYYRVKKRFQDYIIASNKLVKAKHKGIELVGHFDFLVLHPELGLKVIDIKSVKPDSWYYKLKEAQEGKFDQGYYEQSNCYANILRVQEASYFQINKENAELLERIIPINRQIFEQTKEIAFEVYDYTLKGVYITANPGWGPSKETPKRYGRECDFCNMWKSCSQMQLPVFQALCEQFKHLDADLKNNTHKE